MASARSATVSACSRCSQTAATAACAACAQMLPRGQPCPGRDPAAGRRTGRGVGRRGRRGFGRGVALGGGHGTGVERGSSRDARVGGAGGEPRCGSVGTAGEELGQARRRGAHRGGGRGSRRERGARAPNEGSEIGCARVVGASRNAVGATRVSTLDAFGDDETLRALEKYSAKSRERRR